MSQADYDIADQSGLSFLAELNTTLDAILSNNSGATAPTTTTPYQWWADTTAGILKQRNAADDGWINILTLGSTVLETANNLSDLANAAAARTNLGIDISTFVLQDSDTGAANLPTGTTAQRPSVPAEGMFRRNSEIASLEEYDGTEWKVVGGTVEVSVSGTAVFTNVDNNIELTNIGDIGLEVGDVIQVSGSTDNDTEFTVEVITDADNVIVNAAHAGGTTTKSLVDETVSVTVTLLAKAKNASDSLGRGWCSPSRSSSVTYTNNTGRAFVVLWGVESSSSSGTFTIDGDVRGFIGASGFIGAATRWQSSLLIPNGSSWVSTRIDNLSEYR